MERDWRDNARKGKKVDHVCILYGSQTGNAEDLAKRIGMLFMDRDIKVSVDQIDDFPLAAIRHLKFVIFICSTTGHGQEPENMKNFYNFIRRRELPKNCLQGVQYVVIGLGDSSYVKYNFVAKIVHKRLADAGARPLDDVILGDEQHKYGCDGGIFPRFDMLWHIFHDFCPKFDEDYTRFEGFIYSMNFVPNSCPPPKKPYVFKHNFLSKHNILVGTCTSNLRVTSDSHFQDTRLLTFQIPKTSDHEPGDICTIMPENSKDNVRTFIKLLRLRPDRKISVSKKWDNLMNGYLYDFISSDITIKDLVKHYLDIQAVPRRSFFMCLSRFSRRDPERSKLEQFWTLKGQEEVYEYCIQPKRSILEVLLDFPDTVSRIDPLALLDLIPPIKPRSFSIASSAALHPNKIQLLVGVVDYKTRLRKTRKGLCSNYLANITEVEYKGSDYAPEDENQCLLSIKRSSFSLPMNDEAPIILIGPGLGIAPFRSFIEFRSQREASLGKTHLYFGCRYEEDDFYFKDELEAYEKQGVITLRVAFSRQEPKKYVQDLIVEDADKIRKLVTEDMAVIYVAGNSKLPEDLRKVLANILTDESYEGGESERTGQKLVAKLEAQGRINYDCW